MKRRSSLFGAWYFLLFIIVVSGCASQVPVAEHGAEWVARPLSELKQEVDRPDSYASRIGWKETTYPLANGNYVYEEPLREGCVIQWEVNSRGTIIGYTTKGKDCSDESLTDDRISRQKTRQDY